MSPILEEFEERRFLQFRSLTSADVQERRLFMHSYLPGGPQN